MTKGEIPGHCLKKPCNQIFYLIRSCLFNVVSFFIFYVLSIPDVSILDKKACSMISSSSKTRTVPAVEL